MVPGNLSMYSSTNRTHLIHGRPFSLVLSPLWGLVNSPRYSRESTREKRLPHISVLVQLPMRLLTTTISQNGAIIRLQKWYFEISRHFIRKTNLSPVPKYLFLKPLLTCYWGKKYEMRETAWEIFCLPYIREKEITKYFIFVDWLFISYIIDCMKQIAFILYFMILYFILIA